MDIVDRLRHPSRIALKREVGDPPGEHFNLDEDDAIDVMREAADAIEILRATVRAAEGQIADLRSRLFQARC